MPPREHAERPATEQKVLRLNQWQVALAVVVLLVSLSDAFGVYAIMPYRQSSLEKHESEAEERYDKIIMDLKSRVKVLEDDKEKQMELLIRMDERLKSVQDKLKIPHPEGDN